MIAKRLMRYLSEEKFPYDIVSELRGITVILFELGCELFFLSYLCTLKR